MGCKTGTLGRLGTLGGWWDLLVLILGLLAEMPLVEAFGTAAKDLSTREVVGCMGSCDGGERSCDVPQLEQ